MKRRYSHTTRNRGLLATPARIAGAVLLFIVIIMLLVRFLAPGVFTTIAKPFWSTGSALTDTVGDTTSFDTRASLQEDRDRLMRENETLSTQNAVLATRAADLERLLGGRTEVTTGVLAGVLARPPVAPYDLLIIDQGARAVVTPGAAAFGPGGIPIGTVADVTDTTARVSLFSTTGRVTEGWIGANRLPVQLTGAGAGAFDARVDAAAGILVGDAIYVPGPGALPIGTVTEVVTDPSSPNVLVRIRGTANPFSITWVTIAPRAP